MPCPGTNFITSPFPLFLFLRGNDPAKRNEPYNAGSPCGDCPNDCENKLCSKSYIQFA